MLLRLGVLMRAVVGSKEAVKKESLSEAKIMWLLKEPTIKMQNATTKNMK